MSGLQRIQQGLTGKIPAGPYLAAFQNTAVALCPLLEPAALVCIERPQNMRAQGVYLRLGKVVFRRLLTPTRFGYAVILFFLYSCNLSSKQVYFLEVPPAFLRLVNQLSQPRRRQEYRVNSLTPSFCAISAIRYA